MAKMSLEEFIDAWNKAKNIKEFCEQTGYSYSSATSMASRYRTAGQKLKILVEAMSEGGKKGGAKKHDIIQQKASS